MFQDFEINHNLVYRDMLAFYHADLDTFQIPVSVSWARTNSRSSVKRSAKKSIAGNKKHGIETRLEQTALIPSKKPLVINFVGKRGFGYISKTRQGTFGVLRVLNGDWLASFARKDGKIVLAAVSRKSMKDALVKLCQRNWAYDPLSGKEYSLFRLYPKVHWQFSDAPDERPKNNTIFLKTNIFAIWEIASCPKPTGRTSTPTNPKAEPPLSANHDPHETLGMWNPEKPLSTNLGESVRL